MSAVKNLFIFATGVAAGSLVTYKFVKDYYEKLSEEESAPVDEETEDATEMDSSEDKKYSEENLNKPDLDTYYSSLLRKNGYTQDESTVGGPYVITPQDFGEKDGYKILSFTVYSDGVVTDDQNELLEDVEGTVGIDSLNHFGEYEADTVFVRNDAFKTDYELLRDNRTYEESLDERSKK